MTNGFLRVAAAVPKVRVADTTANTQEIENLMVAADGKKIDILCFPELSITAYTCQDLFSQQLLLEEAEHALMKILELSRNLQVTTLVWTSFLPPGHAVKLRRGCTQWEVARIGAEDLHSQLQRILRTALVHLCHGLTRKRTHTFLRTIRTFGIKAVV